MINKEWETSYHIWVILSSTQDSSFLSYAKLTGKELWNCKRILAHSLSQSNSPWRLLDHEEGIIILQKSVNIYQLIQCNNPKHLDLLKHCCGNLKSCIKSLYVGKIPNNLNIQSGTPSNFKCKMWQKFPIYLIFPLCWEDSGSYFLQAVQFSCHIAMAAQFLWQKECPWSLCKYILALLRILSSAIKRKQCHQDRTRSTH